jgi:tetratricopeptide (TPR) repeat protein
MPYLLLIDPTDAVAHAASVELEAVTPVSFIESARGASDSGHAGRPRRPFSVALESVGQRDDLQESAEDSGWLAYQAMRAEFLLPTDLDHLRARITSNQPAPPTAPPGHADDGERPPVPGIRLRLRVPAFNRAVEGRSGDLLLALATVTFTLERAGYWSAVAQGLWPAQEPADPPRERFADYAATGTLDEEGRVGAVGGAAVKVDAAINKLPPGGLVFYPRANESEISAEQLEAADSRGVTLHAVERWEDAAQLLGVRLERYWPGNPWLGLSAYQPHHRKIYFCRDAELADAIDKLRRRAERGTPGLLILAASGVGKSSFARCGMVAEVKAMLGPKMLGYVIWTPGQAVRGDTAGRDDVRALATSIHAQLADVPALSDLRGDAPPDFAALEASLSPLLTPARPLLLVVDQLEELFAADFAADAVTAFCEFVVQLQGLGVWVLATLPDAFFGAYKQQPALLRAFGDEGQFNLPAVSKEALRQAIVEPARRARLRFARDERARTTLADRIHADVQGEIDALPLLSFVLNRLYLNHDRVQGLLTWRAYEEEGGLSGAIGREAERAFAALPPAAQDELPRLLRALVRAGAENGAHASVPVVMTEADWPEHGAGRTLVRALVKERLLVEEGRAAAGGANAQVRIAHRALLSNWERAGKLLSENREVMLTRDRLEQRAREWVGDPAAYDELLSSQRDLAAARELREELGAELDTAQYRRLAAFIAASLAAQAQREQAAEAAQQREQRRVQQELDRERRAKVRLRFWAWSAGIAAILAAAAAGLAGAQWRNAATQRAEAQETYALALRNARETMEIVRSRMPSGRLVTLTPASQDKYGITAEVAKELLEKTRKAFAELPTHRDTEHSLVQRLELFLTLAESLSKGGHYVAALEATEEALRLGDDERVRDALGTRRLRYVTEARLRKGFFLAGLERPEPGLAKREYQAAIDICLSQIDVAKDAIEWNKRLLEAYDALGDAHRSLFEFDAALANYSESAKLVSLLLHDAFGSSRRSDTLGLRRKEAILNGKIGDVYAAAGNFALAKEHHRKNLEISSLLALEDKENVDFFRGLAIAHERLGYVQRKLKDLSSANERYQEALKINLELSKKDEGNINWTFNLAYTYLGLADVFRDAGEWTKAEENYLLFLGNLESLRARGVLHERLDRDILTAYQRLADLHRSRKRAALALEYLRKCTKDPPMRIFFNPRNSEPEDPRSSCVDLLSRS